MKVNQTTNICPRLKPVQLPLVGKCVSINSATRIFCRKAMMTGISSVRSWVIVMCSLIPRAYLNAYFLAKIRTNCELYGLPIALPKKWPYDLPMNQVWSGRRGFEADWNRCALIRQVHRTQPCDDLHQPAVIRPR